MASAQGTRRAEIKALGDTDILSDEDADYAFGMRSSMTSTRP